MYLVLFDIKKNPNPIAKSGSKKKKGTLRVYFCCGSPLQAKQAKEKSKRSLENFPPLKKACMNE